MHLLSALAPHVGVTLAPQAVDDKTNEMTAVETRLHQLVLAGRVMPMDALLTQRHVAQTIVANGGDDVMMVKENQPQLHADIALVFARPPWGDVQETASSVEMGHGRIDQRTLTVRTALAGLSPWPGLAQVFQWERQVTRKKTGEERSEVVDGVSRLGAERATPSQRLAFVRGQWQIEHRSHGVRDVPCDEDRSQVRCGSMPQVMAARRHTAIGRLRAAGYTNIAAACRRFAAQPDLALGLIGITLEN
jgi:predicted transposase YbfD/YdcC